MIAYLTDVEGRWDKVLSFTDGNPYVSLDDGALRLAEGVTFVFGGDAIDRGPHGRRIVALLLAARRAYGERVVLLAGNRDINKLRLTRELDGEPPSATPPEVRAGGRGALLRWIFANTMGASQAFEHRAAELASEGRRSDDDAVVDSYLEDLAPGGVQRAYLAECRLGYRTGTTLFVHGGVTLENLGAVPGQDDRRNGIDAWVAALDEFYAGEMNAFVAGRTPDALIAYQAPRKGTKLHQESVVYARLTDELANPCLPAEAVVARLRASGVRRVVVGHTPSGDCPAIVREGDFELVFADNSYGRIEHGSQVFIDDERTHVRATSKLDDGTQVAVDFASELANGTSPLGKREATTGQLVKARLASGEYLLFRGLRGYQVEQTKADVQDLARRSFVVAR